MPLMPLDEETAYVRCLTCLAVVPEDFFYIHSAEECSGVPLFEEIKP